MNKSHHFSFVLFLLATASTQCFAIQEDGKSENRVVQLIQRGLEYYSSGKYKTAEFLFAEAVKVSAEKYGEKTRLHASAMNAAGFISTLRGNYIKADQFLSQALELRRQSALAQTNEHVACSLGNLGHLYMCLEEFERAKDVLEECLAIAKAIYHEQKEEVALRMNQLGLCYLALRDLDKADRYIREGTERRKKGQGLESWSYAEGLHCLGLLYLEKKDYSQAEPCLERAVQIMKKQVPAHPICGECLGTLGRSKIAQGKTLDGRFDLEEALAIREKEIGTENPQLLPDLIAYGQALRTLDKTEEAEKVESRVKKIQAEFQKVKAECAKLRKQAPLGARN